MGHSRHPLSPENSPPTLTVLLWTIPPTPPSGPHTWCMPYD